jgi:hypothetical protein
MTTWGMTVRVPATLHFADGTEIAGALHVQSAVGTHPGPETVAELLNRPEPFLPLSLDEDGVRFVPKAQVALVETAAPGPEDAERRSAVRFVSLEVSMMSDRLINGFAECELPPNRSRALDLLNDGGAFFALTAEATLWAVNRTHVRTVRPVD